jgi:hypothetical protein
MRARFALLSRGLVAVAALSGVLAFAAGSLPPPRHESIRVAS